MKKLILFAIFAVLIAPNAHAASPSVTDAGQNSSYTCYEVSGTAVGQDDTSLTPDIDASTCAGTETVLYNSRGPSGITTSNIQRKKSCTSCKSGYSLVSHTGISTRARGPRKYECICGVDKAGIGSIKFVPRITDK